MIATLVINTDFTDTPGTMKSDPGGMVTLTWNLTTVFNPEMFGARVDITSGDGTYIVGYYYAGSPTTCNTYSDTRITCIIPATPGPNVGFSITGITDADADQYTCKVVHQLDGTPVTDRDAYIYVYSKFLYISQIRVMNKAFIFNNIYNTAMEI